MVTVMADAETVVGICKVQKMVSLRGFVLMVTIPVDIVRLKEIQRGDKIVFKLTSDERVFMEVNHGLPPKKPGK